MAKSNPPEPSVRAYFRELLNHAANLYSRIALVFAILSFLGLIVLWWRGDSPSSLMTVLAWGAGLFALASFFPASYLAWAAAIRNWAAAIPAMPRLRVEVAEPPTLLAPFDSETPKSPGEFWVKLRVRNPALEPVEILKIISYKWNVPHPAFGAPHPAPTIEGRNYRQQFSTLTPPIPIGRQEMREDLTLKVKADILTDPIEAFARQLPSLKNYSITLRIEWSTLEGVTDVCEVEARGSFDEFRRAAFDAWENRNRGDLLKIAGGLDRL